MDTKKILSLSVAVVVLTFCGAYAYITTTPHYSLYQLRNALKNHDPEQALLFIDIDSIVDNFLRNTIQKQNASSKNHWEKMGNSFGAGLALMMAPAMKESLKSQFKSAIASADDKGDFQKIKNARFWDGEIAVNGGSAILTINNNGITKFKMIKTTDGHWKIIEIITSDNL